MEKAMNFKWKNTVFYIKNTALGSPGAAMPCLQCGAQGGLSGPADGRAGGAGFVALRWE